MERERGLCPRATEGGAALVLLAFGLVTAACSGAELADWMDSGQHPKYPQGRYVLGVGWGDTITTADDRARGELAKFFQAAVENTTLEAERYAQLGTGDDAQVTHDFDLKYFTRVRSKVELEGVEIRERVVREGLHYSLAVLDKVAMKRRLSERLSDVELEIAERLDEPGTDPGTRVKALARAIWLMGERARLMKQLALLGVGGGVDPTERVEAIAELRELLVAHFMVSVAGMPDELSTPVRAALLAEGMAVARADAAGAIRITGTLDLRDEPGGELPRVVYHVMLQARSGDETVAAVDHMERVAHPSAQTARLKALQEVKQRAAVPLVAKIRDHVLGDFQGKEVDQ